MPHRYGHAVLCGRPNVGKSTLLNAMVGMPISIVTPKPHTTRFEVRGIVTRPDAQIALLDAPGIEGGARAIGRRLGWIGRHAVASADVLVQVVEALRWTDSDESVWRLVATRPGVPRLLVVNKVDKVRDKAVLLPYAKAITDAHPFDGVHFLCARRNDGVTGLCDDLAGRLPEGPARFDAQIPTDRSVRFLAAEFVREQVMRQLSDELPYAAAVDVTEFDESGDPVKVRCRIWVERPSQKAIVIGAGGERIKAIGTAARIRIERMLGRHVYLELAVEVHADWSDDAKALDRLGYAVPR